MSMKAALRLSAIGLFTAFSVYVAGCFAPGGAPESDEREEAVAEADQGLVTLCGGAGQPCCGGVQTCTIGLVCNSQNICRKPCGNIGERCCSGSTCTFGICDTSSNTCLKPSGSSSSSGGSSGGSSGSSSSSSGLLPQCTSSLQCPIGFSCVNAMCVENSSNGGSGCTSDLQCTGSQVCRNGYCCDIDPNDPNNSLCPLVPPYYN